MNAMQRILATGCLLAILLFTVSCGDDPSGSLSYQDKDCVFTGVCKLEDGEYTVQIHIQPDGSRELLFIAPETLAGCSYQRTPQGEYSFTAEDTVFPVSANPTVETIFGLFELDEADLLSASVDENSGAGLNVLTFAGDVTVYLSSEDGLPLRFEHPLLTLTLHADGREMIDSPK